MSQIHFWVVEIKDKTLIQLPAEFPEIEGLKSHTTVEERTLEGRLAKWRESSGLRIEGTEDIKDEEISKVFFHEIVTEFRYVVNRYRNEGKKRYDGSWQEEHSIRVGEILTTIGFDHDVAVAGLYHRFFNDFSRRPEDISTLIKEVRNQTGSDIVVKTALQMTNKYSLLFNVLSNDNTELTVSELKKRIEFLEHRLRRKRVINHYRSELDYVSSHLEKLGNTGTVNLKSMEVKLYEDYLTEAFLHSKDNRNLYFVFLANLLDDISTSEYMSLEKFVEIAKRTWTFLDVGVNGDGRAHRLKTRLAYTTMKKIYDRIKGLERSEEYIITTSKYITQLMEVYGGLRTNHGEDITTAIGEVSSKVSIIHKGELKNGVNELLFNLEKILGVLNLNPAHFYFSDKDKVWNADITIRGHSPQQIMEALTKQWSRYFRKKSSYTVHPIL